MTGSIGPYAFRDCSSLTNVDGLSGVTGALVTHHGHVWRNDHGAGNAWEPGTTGSQWTDLGPAEQ